MSLGWWRSWLARRSHSLLSDPEVESSSLSHPNFKSITFYIRYKFTFLSLKNYRNYETKIIFKYHRGVGAVC